MKISMCSFATFFVVGKDSGEKNKPLVQNTNSQSSAALYPTPFFIEYQC